MEMQLPPGGLGSAPSMPGALPGLGRPGTVMPPGAMPMMPAGGPPGLPSFGGMPSPDDPAAAQYVAVTQSDGSILLHMKLPDGTTGPAVKIINAIKPKRAAGAAY